MKNIDIEDYIKDYIDSIVGIIMNIIMNVFVFLAFLIVLIGLPFYLIKHWLEQEVEE